MAHSSRGRAGEYDRRAEKKNMKSKAINKENGVDDEPKAPVTPAPAKAPVNGKK